MFLRMPIARAEGRAELLRHGDVRDQDRGHRALQIELMSREI